MIRKWSWVLLLAIVAIVVAAGCAAQPAATPVPPTAKPAAAPTQAPAPTKAPEATKSPEPTKAPAPTAAAFNPRSAATGSPAQVTGQPKLAVDREQIDFGKVPLDKTVKATFKLTNVGDQPLQILSQPVVEVKQGC